MMNTKHASVIGATHAVSATRIPTAGRRISYRGYLIHGEVPNICYVIYGRNRHGQLTELGATRGFPEAMQWIDRHLDDLRDLMPVEGEAHQAPRRAGYQMAA